MFGQNPLQRRVQTPFGNPGLMDGIQGRSDFTGGILGGPARGRSGFGGFGSSRLDFGNLFEGVSWDPNTGMRTKGMMPGQTSGGGTVGGLSSNGATPYDQAFIDAAREMSARYGVNLDPALLKAMGHIESGGTFNNNLSRDDGFGDGNSVGIMQVKPSIWGSLVPDANPYDPVGNIRLGAAIMAKSIAQYGSWEAALTNVYFPVNDPNGTTQQMYVDQARQYMQQYSDGMGGMSGGSALGPGKGMGKGQFSGFGSGTGWTSVFGPAGTPISYEYDAPTVNGDMYNYAASSGMSGWSHPGLDVAVARNTPLYSPGSGTVSCVGYADAGVGGTGGGSCGYFGDTDGGGVGNVTIKLDNGTFVILGHSASANVQPGQRVNAGQLVATSGGMKGAHTHLEVRVPDPSTPSGYRIVDPRTVLGGGAGNPGGSVVSGSPQQPQNSGVQAANGAYYSFGYQIPTRWSR